MAQLTGYFEQNGPVQAIIYTDGTNYYSVDERGHGITAPSTVFSTVFNNTVTALSSGGTIMIRTGNYTATAALSMSNNMTIKGEGYGNTTITKGFNGNLMYLNGDHDNVVMDLKFAGQRASFTGRGCFVDTGASGFNNTFKNCLFSGFADWAVEFKQDRNNCESCIFEDMGAGAVSATGTAGTAVTGCHISDNKVINFGQATAGQSAIRVAHGTRCHVVNNKVESAETGAVGGKYGILITGSAGGNNVVGGNTVNGTFEGTSADGLRLENNGNACFGNVVVNAEGDGIGNTGDRNTIFGNVCEDNDLNGVEMATGADFNVVLGNVAEGTTADKGVLNTGAKNIVIGNVAVNNNDDGIKMEGADGICIGNQAWDNDVGAAGAGVGGIRVAASNNIVLGNRCSDDATTQDTGIVDESGTDSIYSGNNVTGNVTSGLTTAGTTPMIRNNRGFVTEAEGTGSIANAATNSGNIAHGLGYTPTAAQFAINFTENPTNTPGVWWISGIDGTNFVVNVENDPGASGLDFSWAIRKV